MKDFCGLNDGVVTEIEQMVGGEALGGIELTVLVES